MSVRSGYIFLFFFIVASAANGQDIKWLKSYGSRQADDIVTGMCAEPDGGSSVLILRYGRVLTNPADTITFDSMLYITPTNTENAVFIVRHDSTGKVIQSKYLGNFSPGTFYSMHRDDFGNYYIAGVTNASTFNTFLKDTLYTKNGNLFFTKISSTYNTVWIKQYGNKITRLLGFNFSNSHLYFICNQDTGLFKIGTFNFNLGYSRQHSELYGELDTSNGKVIWANYLGNNGSLRITNIIKMDSSLYLSAYNPGNTYKIGTDSFHRGCGAIVQLDSIGNYQKRFEFHNNNFIVINSLVSDGKNIYFGGQFKDTLRWANKVFLPQYIGNYIYYETELFSAAITLDFKPLWFIRPTTSDNSKPSGTVYTVKFSQGFLYFGGTLTSDITFGDFMLTAAPANPDMLLFKTDIYGNILWAIDGDISNGALLQIDAQFERGVFGSGVYRGTLNLQNYQTTSKGSLTDVFITKISDNAIIRGEVQPGPYCAGDSIAVPYSKIGNYDTSNYFIAQLSNEEGNFDQGYYTLGKIKSNTHGTVKGVLPATKINSSGKYRIRIMSTAPAVQSYYKADTLRLLIYSRDKANPGRDTTICPGDTVQLRTYGGTQWVWSPKYRMQDSTSYKTRVWPDKTTRYRIIISDSSGCGIRDTAYKTVIVRSNPKIRILTKKDTAVCLGATVPIISAFTQGDSTSYQWIWYSISPQGVWTELKTGSKQLKDTLNFKMPVSAKDSQRLLLFLNDGCNKKTDFQYYTIYITKSKAKAQLNKDTTVCAGTTAALTTQFVQGTSPDYNWRWYQVPVSGTWTALSTQRSGKIRDTLYYTLPAGTTQPRRIGVVVKDNCSGLSDTAYQRVLPADTLQLKLTTKDTWLCKGNTYTFKATGMGGNPTGYQYRWFNTKNDTLSKIDSLIYTAQSTDTISVRLSDGCMAKTSSQQLKINVLPEINSRVKIVNSVVGDTAVCQGVQLALHATTTGGKGNGYTYNWTINNTAISSNDSIVIHPSLYTADTGGIVTLQLITTDNCTTAPDTNTIRITVLPKLRLQIQTLDSICYKSLFTMKAKGAGGKPSAYTYKWLNQQLQTESTTDSLQLNYFAPGQAGTKIYNIVLNDGCSQADTVKVTRVLIPPVKLAMVTYNPCPDYKSILSANSSGGKGYGYTYAWWQDGVKLNSTRDTVTVYTNGASHAYQVTATDGCSTPDTARLNLGLKPIVTLEHNIDTGCNPLLMQFTIKTDSKEAFTWTLYSGQSANDSILGNQSNLNALVNYTTGIYRAKVKIRTAGGCITEAQSRDIKVHPHPVTNFTTNPQYYLTPKYSVVRLENHSTSANYYKWLFPPLGSSTDTNVTIDYKGLDTGTYRITLISASGYGCTDSVTRNIVMGYDLQLLVPDAFSPNGDGINEVFRPIAVGVKTLHLRIFNRWGEMLYSSSDRNAGWDGTFEGKEVPPGAYLYTVEVKGIYGPIEHYKGMLYLLR